MQSKIKFDLTEQNYPCIIMEVSKNTEDLRDKVAQRFLEELGHESNLLNITFLPGDGTKAIILPVSKMSVDDPSLVDMDILAMEFIQDELQNKLDSKGMNYLLVTINKCYDVEETGTPIYQAYLYNPSNMHWKDGYYIAHRELSTTISEITQYVSEEISNPKLKR